METVQTRRALAFKEKVKSVVFIFVYEVVDLNVAQIDNKNWYLYR